MPINKPIPDSVISFWKKQFQKIREIINEYLLELEGMTNRADLIKFLTII